MSFGRSLEALGGFWEVLEELLGASWKSLGHLGACFLGTWGVLSMPLGASWKPLGHLGAPLGGALGALGRPWGSLRNSCRGMQFPPAFPAALVVL